MKDDISILLKRRNVCCEKLDNLDFINNAPYHIVLKEKEKLSNYDKQLFNMLTSKISEYIDPTFIPYFVQEIRVSIIGSFSPVNFDFIYFEEITWLDLYTLLNTLENGFILDVFEKTCELYKNY